MAEKPPDPDTELVFDASPYLKLEIDREGRWFQNGAEIVHPAIYRAFSRMLERTSDGGYLVRLGREICRVHVEDAPFVVQRIIDTCRSSIVIQLNDGTKEQFEPHRFWIGNDNIPYTSVKDGSFHARFSRPAYYQLAKHIVSSETERSFFFMIGGEKVPIELKGDDVTD